MGGKSKHPWWRATVLKHAALEIQLGRKWGPKSGCACGPCQAARKAGFEPPTFTKCEVPACPRYFLPGVTGADGRCPRCFMRKRRGRPDVTAAEAQEAEARAAGEVGPRSVRVIGYIRPALAEALQEHLAVHKGSESELVNHALAAFLRLEELA